MYINTSAELIYIISCPGINLAGRQKARVNFARALHAPHKDLYLPDDSLATVDDHVGKKIFENALTKHSLTPTHTPPIC